MRTKNRQLPDSIAQDLARQLRPSISERLAPLIPILVPLLLFLVNGLGYIITTSTHKLLLLPLSYAGFLACATVALLSLFFYIIKKGSELVFGIFKILIGLSAAFWTVIDVRLGHEDMKGVALWIGLLVTLDLIVDGLDNMFHKRRA
jgi:hypothetical protein